MTKRDPVTPRDPNVSRSPRDPVTHPLRGVTRGTRSEHASAVTPVETDRTALDLARLKAKHQRFAEVTNQLITEQYHEIQRLRALLNEGEAS